MAKGPASWSRQQKLVSGGAGVGVVILLASFLGLARQPGEAGPPAPQRYAGPCADLTVSAYDTSGTLEKLANDYSGGDSLGHKCARVHVERRPSGDVESALARGWPEGLPTETYGDRPDVWVPG